MLACSACEQWFHGACVGVEDAQSHNAAVALQRKRAAQQLEDEEEEEGGGGGGGGSERKKTEEEKEMEEEEEEEEEEMEGINNTYVLGDEDDFYCQACVAKALSGYNKSEKEREGAEARVKEKPQQDHGHQREK